MILDTNGLSAWAEGDETLKPVLQQVEEVALPVIVLGEYRYGIRQSRNRNRYERWLAGLVSNCRLLSVDETTAKEYADIHYELRRKGRTIPGNDVWIAALARQHTLPLLSRDRHFDFVAGVKRVAW